MAVILKSKYGGEWYRPDERDSGCMSRMSVGLVKKPANFLIGNSQLQMAA